MVSEVQLSEGRYMWGVVFHAMEWGPKGGESYKQGCSEICGLQPKHRVSKAPWPHKQFWKAQLRCLQSASDLRSVFDVSPTFRKGVLLRTIGLAPEQGLCFSFPNTGDFPSSSIPWKSTWKISYLPSTKSYCIFSLVSRATGVGTIFCWPTAPCSS